MNSSFQDFVDKSKKKYPFFFCFYQILFFHHIKIIQHQPPQFCSYVDTQNQVVSLQTKNLTRIFNHMNWYLKIVSNFRNTCTMWHSLFYIKKNNSIIIYTIQEIVAMDEDDERKENFLHQLNAVVTKMSFCPNKPVKKDLYKVG